MGIAIQADELTSSFTTSSNGLGTAIDIRAFSLAGMVMPTTWSTASITFTVSTSLNGTYHNLYDDAGVEVTSTGTVSAYAVSLDSLALKLAPWRYIKPRSGTSGTPVAQSTNVEVRFILKG